MRQASLTVSRMTSKDLRYFVHKERMTTTIQDVAFQNQKNEPLVGIHTCLVLASHPPPRPGNPQRILMYT